jgi:ribose transport system permease protein/putative xylitol transport system permease protein
MIVLNQRTRFGRYIVAIGAGEQVAQLSGIPVRRYKTAAFVLSGAMAGLGGAFLLSELGSATPQLGGSYLLEVIAAIVVGGTALTGGVGAVSRTLLGVVLITILSNGLNVSGVSPWTQEIVTGLVIIVAVLTTLDRERMQDIIK